MKVSFIVPLHGGLNLTRACLASLRATIPRDLPHEVLVVDDLSPDSTREWLVGLEGRATGIRVILNEANLGFAATCNRGASTASGDILFFLNNDLILMPGWCEPMMTLTIRRDAGLVGNIQLNARTGEVDHAGIQFDAKGKPTHQRSISPLARVRGWLEVPALTGACLAIRRDLWNALGGFDDGFLNGAEDVDLGLRARAAGRRNRVSLRSVVKHHISASPGRKRHDEANSWRLAARWRREIGILAAPSWCRHRLDCELAGTGGPIDFRFAFAALLVATGLRLPPPAILAQVDETLESEFVRWREMAADGRPLPPPRNAVL